MQYPDVVDSNGGTDFPALGTGLVESAFQRTAKAIPMEQSRGCPEMMVAMVARLLCLQPGTIPYPKEPHIT